ncbi:MAG: hypothetical protein QOH31_4272 [Verrucomicrobiota bacterium]|jgi:hypothetical protein
MVAWHTCATIFTFKELVYRLATRRHIGWKWDEIVGAPSRCGTLATFAARSCGYFAATSPARSVRYAPSLRCAVLRAIAFLGLFCLAPNTVAHTKDELGTFSPKPLDIHVQVNGFGKVSSADIAAVLQSAALEIWKHCPHCQLDGIDVYYRADHPQTDFKRAPSGRIGIGLSARDTHWAQYAFQFAHEFCHALANYSNDPQRSVRYPRHANLWLEESLCETASLFALRVMSRSWRTAPPYPAWRSYAPWLNDYVEHRLALPEHQLPAGTSFLVWFHENQAALRQNSDLRGRNTIIAIQFLPIFEAEPRGWGAVAFLNRGSSNPEESLAQRLVEWRSQCPEDLRPFVTRLAGVFAMKLERLRKTK